MLGVQLPTCVSSPVQSTKVRLEFSPIVPHYVLFCFWVGPNYLKSRTAFSTEALCLFPAHVAVNIHLLLVWLTILPSSPLLLRVSVPVSGLPVSTMIFWKGVSLPLGMAINLISLLWTILHSSHRRWLFITVHVRGVESWYAYDSCIGGHRSFSFYCGLFFYGLFVSVVSVLALEGVSAFVFCCLSRRPFYCPTSSTPTVSSLRTRSRSPCHTKRPLVLLRPRGDVSPVVTGAPPGSLSARCVVFTVSPCLIIIPLFSVL